MGVKCGADREEADEWLTRFPDDASVMPYIGRSGWNTLRIGGAIPDDGPARGRGRVLRHGGGQAAAARAALTVAEEESV